MNIRNIIDVAFQVAYWLLFIRVLLSWFRLSPHNPIIRFIYEVTEPMLAPFRKILPISPNLPIDFSPILAFFALQLLRSLVMRLL